MIKLLVVDDSPLMRRLLTEIFAASGEFEVIAARSGSEALEQLHNWAPDVITLDIHMPGMDGLACLNRIMLERPCPVVMVSSLTEAGADETLEAMALGAVDFVAKPKGAISLHMDGLAPMLIAKVLAAASARISRVTRLRERVRLRTAAITKFTSPKSLRFPAAPIEPLPFASGLVLVGASTGGPPALDIFLGDLPGDFPWPIVIAQHMPASFTGPLARRLDRLSALSVSEVDRTTPLEPGCAYIARGDADILISRRAETIVALAAPKSSAHHWHPSVERLVEGAMQVIEPELLIGILMTGMGTDGAAAMTALKARGGRTIAESEETAVVWGMPGALVSQGGAGQVQPLDRIAPALLALFAA